MLAKRAWAGLVHYLITPHADTAEKGLQVEMITPLRMVFPEDISLSPGGK